MILKSIGLKPLLNPKQNLVAATAPVRRRNPSSGFHYRVSHNDTALGIRHRPVRGMDRAWEFLCEEVSSWRM